MFNNKIVAYAIIDDCGQFLAGDSGQTYGTFDDAQAALRKLIFLDGDELSRSIVGLVDMLPEPWIPAWL